jgi:hypothetical protein
MRTFFLFNRKVLDLKLIFNIRVMVSDYHRRQNELVQKYDLKVSRTERSRIIFGYNLRDGWGFRTRHLESDPQFIRKIMGTLFVRGAGLSEEDAGYICLWVCDYLGLETPW